MGRENLGRKHWILFITLPVVLVLDQVTKSLVIHSVPLHQSIPVIRGFFNITHVKNTGAAFGVFSGYTSPVRTLFFTAITIAALAFIILIYRKVRTNRVLVPFCLSLIMAGALGNMVDRIRWGYVTDFLDLYWRTYRWPAFNVADSAITIGICLLLLDSFLLRKPAQDPQGMTRSDGRGGHDGNP
jgi:signal peptidase II